jgi:hypothetical protein
MKSSITAALAWLLMTAPGVPAQAASDSPATLQVLPVRLLPGSETSVLDNLVNVHLVKGQGQAALQLDIAHKRILDSQGLLVVEYDAHNPLALQGTVDKWRYVRALQVLSAAHPQDIHVDPASMPAEQLTPPLPRIYNHGTVTYVVTKVPAPRQVVVFNLDAIGDIQLLFFPGCCGPGESDTVSIPAEVRPLFGEEHVVAVSASDPQQMRALISWLYETHLAEGMIDTRGAILQQIAALKDVRVGLVAVYTCESASNCKR